MRKLIEKTMIFALLMVVGASACSAQNGNKRQMARERLAENQAYYIANQLALDDRTTNRFVVTYCNYKKEVWELRPRAKSRDGSDADTDAQMKARFDHRQKILQLREKYYGEYRKFLTPKQIENVYQLEYQMMRQLTGQRPKKRARLRNEINTYWTLPSDV
jgi:hypothetical protein